MLVKVSVYTIFTYIFIDYILFNAIVFLIPRTRNMEKNEESFFPLLFLCLETIFQNTLNSKKMSSFCQKKKKN